MLVALFSELKERNTLLVFHLEAMCGWCVQGGDYLDRITFPEVRAEKRTNESFRQKSQREHHLQDSTFLQLPIDMV